MKVKLLVYKILCGLSYNLAIIVGVLVSLGLLIYGVFLSN